MDHPKNDFSILYICKNCSKSIEAPKHCGRAMQIKANDGIITWLCWKGDHAPCCGKPASFVFDSCCEDPNLVMQFHEILT